MNETLLYIILGVLYLVFTAIGRAAKKKEAQARREQEWSLEDAMRDLQGDSVDQTESTTAPATSAPSEWSDEWSGNYPAYGLSDELRSSESSVRDLFTPESAEFAAPYIPAPPSPAKVPAPPGAHVDAAVELNPIAELLKNQKSARNAIILSEILRKPKGARGFPRPNLRR